jgi:hypothetical protein
MPDSQCFEAMNFLNSVLEAGVDPGIVARLEAGEHPGAILAEFGANFGTSQQLQALTNTIATWPAVQVELASRLLGWGLAKKQAGDQVRSITVSGDDEHSTTVTRVELEDGDLRISFAHPPA